MTKKLSDAGRDVQVLIKAKRHRYYFWCRLWNGYLDDPMLRVVADMTALPLYQVQAFVTRLESFANQADPRGYVGEFSAALFGAAMGMPTEQAASLFAALEHPDVRWIDQDHIAAFWSRNRDKEDTDNTARKQRSRARQDIRKELAKRARQGLIDEDQRDGIESMLELIEDPPLFALRSDLKIGVALEPSLRKALSTSHAGHIVTVRDIVTVTPRADHIFKEGTVDNSGEAARSTAPGQPKQGEAAASGLSTVEAELWLAGEAVRLLVERFGERRPRIEVLIPRWRRELDDDPVETAALIAGLCTQTLSMARLELLVADHCRRRMDAKLKGEPLPLPPVPIGGASLSTERRHDVTAPAVDNLSELGSNGDSQRSGTDG